MARGYLQVFMFVLILNADWKANSNIASDNIDSGLELLFISPVMKEDVVLSTELSYYGNMNTAHSYIISTDHGDEVCSTAYGNNEKIMSTKVLLKGCMSKTKREDLNSTNHQIKINVDSVDLIFETMQMKFKNRTDIWAWPHILGDTLNGEEYCQNKTELDNKTSIYNIPHTDIVVEQYDTFKLEWISDDLKSVLAEDNNSTRKYQSKFYDHFNQETGLRLGEYYHCKLNSLPLLYSFMMSYEHNRQYMETIKKEYMSEVSETVFAMLLPLLIVSAIVSLDAQSQAAESKCSQSETTVSGTHAPATVCAGELIFEENFDELDLEKWQHENTLSGGGNWEFQYYNNNRTNSYTEYGLLYIRPSLLSDQYGEDYLTSGTLNIEGGAPADRCTNPRWYGCERTGSPTNILNPIKSARIRTVESFTFQYGRVEARAKMPAGDWLWPAIWLMPAYNAYGTWPASGEIDIVESRGNLNMYQGRDHIGTQEAGSTLHFGPYPELDRWETTTWVKRNSTGYDAEFHRYQLEWTPTYLSFSIDDQEIGRIAPGKGGFWEHGGFSSAGNIQNPWAQGTNMAPFDQKFYLIINLAVGGTNGFFPDNVSNPSPKPWNNASPTAARDFWNRRNDWLPTWKLDENGGKDASLQVDYVRIWAL